MVPQCYASKPRRAGVNSESAEHARRRKRIAPLLRSTRSLLFDVHGAQGTSELWNIQISDKVTAPVIRQTIKRGHGNM